MKTIFLILSGLLACFSSSAADDPAVKDGSSLVIGVKTNSVEGFGKFNVIAVNGDTVYAVSTSTDVLPGMYLITSTNRNPLYHKKLWVLDKEIASVLGYRSQFEMFAMITGVLDFENYAKLNVNTTEESYFYASDDSGSFQPGTYLITGSSDHSLYHQKLVVTPR